MEPDFLSQSLRARYHLDPATGQLYFKERDNWIFNRRWADKLAKPRKLNDSSDLLYYRIGSVDYKAENVVWAIVSGEWPTRRVLHMNGNRSDNRPSNLYLAGTLPDVL